MTRSRKPICMEFPLRGEWLSPNTPGAKVPSHGTNKFGARYAYDFVQVDWERPGWPAYRASFWRYLFLGLPLEEYYCWGQNVYAPCDGVVVQAADGCEERAHTNLFLDLRAASRNAHSFHPQKNTIQTVAGNYVMIQFSAHVYAALVHFQTGSVQVEAGQRVKKGDLLGRVGHSGNSFAPHLHFQLMDSDDIATAKGLPCAFNEYEVFQKGAWQKVKNGIPTNKQRMRKVEG